MIKHCKKNKKSHLKGKYTYGTCPCLLLPSWSRSHWHFPTISLQENSTKISKKSYSYLSEQDLLLTFKWYLCIWRLNNQWESVMTVWLVAKGRMTTQMTIYIKVIKDFFIYHNKICCWCLNDNCAHKESIISVNQ